MLSQSKDGLSKERSSLYTLEGKCSSQPDFKLTHFKAGEIVSNMGSRKKKRKRKKKENKFGLRYPV